VKSISVPQTRNYTPRAVCLGIWIIGTSLDNSRNGEVVVVLGESWETSNFSYTAVTALPKDTLLFLTAIQNPQDGNSSGRGDGCRSVSIVEHLRGPQAILIGSVKSTKFIEERGAEPPQNAVIDASSQK
jgi:hypothetical protein